MLYCKYDALTILSGSVELSFKVDYFIPVENSGRVQWPALYVVLKGKKKFETTPNAHPPPRRHFVCKSETVFLRNTVR